MNILLICDEYPPGRHGGIGSAVQLLARQYAQSGHQVVVAGFYDWGYGGADFFEDEGVPVYRFRRRLDGPFFGSPDRFIVKAVRRALLDTGLLERDLRRSLPRYQAFLESLIARYEIDIVELPDYQDYLRFCRAPLDFPALSRPVVLKLHGSLSYFAGEAGTQPPPAALYSDRALYRQADAVSSVSAYTARRTAVYMQNDRPAEIVYNGIETRPASAPPGKEPGLVLFTGSLSAKKGVYPLMEAWNQVAAEWPSARLELYGKGPVEALRNLLSPSCRDSVSFCGHVGRPQLLARLAQAEAAVFPSFAECFALAPMEAMAGGTAVVYTKLSSGPELVTDGQDGLLADPGRPEEIADCLLRLLQDPPLRARLSEAGQRSVAERFDISVVARHNIDFYRQVLRQHPARRNAP